MTNELDIERRTDASKLLRQQAAAEEAEEEEAEDEEGAAAPERLARSLSSRGARTARAELALEPPSRKHAELQARWALKIQDCQKTGMLVSLHSECQAFSTFEW